MFVTFVLHIFVSSTNNKAMEQEQLDEIVRLHGLWLRKSPDGKRADLDSADLRGADLRDADLAYADLDSADLREADLRGVNLGKADLRWAKLNAADLREADLRWAKLNAADLTDAKLRCANLSKADLHWAKLSDADLSDANLSGVNLNGADLSGAVLTGAELSGAIVALHYNVGLINFSGGSQGRISVYDAKNDLVHCGCWSGTLYEFVKRVSIQYKSGFERKSYLLEILKLRAFKQHYKSLTNN